jgi:hypothetical protein
MNFREDLVLEKMDLFRNRNVMAFLSDHLADGGEGTHRG